MIAGGIKAPEVLDELESHLREDLEKQVRLGMDWQKAFSVASQRIGEAHLLKREFQKSVRGFNHNRIYCLLLATLAAYNLVTILSGWWLLHLAGGQWTGPLGNVPEWALPWLSALVVSYTTAMFVTLLARRYRPNQGRKLTRFLNWALLLALPLGPVVGLYGLCFVDKDVETHDAAAATH
jgi:hypothetical protein